MKRLLKPILASLLSLFILSTTSFAATTTTPAANTANNSAVINNTSNPGLVPITTAPPVPSPSSMPQQPLVIPPPPALNCQSYVLMDADTGQVIAQSNMNEKRAPASLTKLMTLYVAFNAIANKQARLTDQVPISKKAWQTGGSRMFITAGSMVPLFDLIQGVIVDSGNDATVAIAEYLAGSEDSFVNLMNQEAQRLGMADTHYSDVNGLPIPDHHSTAYDLAILTRALIKNYPNEYHWFKEKYFTWNNIRQPNRNRLLWIDPSVDGLKTGFTDKAGYCLIASAKRGSTRLISVVLGAPSISGRVDDSQRLLNYGFRFFSTHEIYLANSPVTQARVWGGAKKDIPLGLQQDLYLTLAKNASANLKVNATLNKILTAPVKQGETYGILTVTLNDKVIAERPLVALQNDPKGNLWRRFADYISYRFHRPKNTEAVAK